MSSPVDTSVKFFRSTMPSAPALRGQVGSIISLLDACLVDGWGRQTATSVIVASGVATATFPSDHAAAPEAVVLVEGATPSGLNGEQKITAVGANVIKWATAVSDGTATGTITIKMAPAGWTKVYSGTNLAVYKSASVEANGQFLRVDDTGATEARVLGYENMTDVSTGTGPFPTNTQVSGGLYWGKSYPAGSADIPWSIAADARAFYFNPASGITNGASAVGGGCYFFGDLVPHSLAGDSYATLLTGVHNVNWDIYGGQYLLSGVNASNCAAPRKFDGTGAAIQPYVTPLSAQSLGGLPNTINGRVSFSPLVMRDSGSAASYRADLPGGRMSMHFSAELAFSPNQVFSDTSGRFRLAMFCSNSQRAQQHFHALAVDVTGPWR